MLGFLKLKGRTGIPMILKLMGNILNVNKQKQKYYVIIKPSALQSTKL
jgi:hypothetical protein